MKKSELQQIIKEEIDTILNKTSSGSDEFSKNKSNLKNNLNDDLFKSMDYFSNYYKNTELERRFKSLTTLMMNLKNDLNKFQRKR